MIAEAGLVALWLAAALSLLQAGLGGLSLKGGERFLATVRPLAITQAILATLAFALLVWLFLRTDLSVALVAANSQIDARWLDKFAGTWGNRDGAMLLWVAMVALAGAVAALRERGLPPRALVAALAAQAAISLGFYAFLLFAANPFARLSPPPSTGRVLDALPGSALHLPTFCLGAAALSVVLCLAIGERVTGDGAAVRTRATRRWMLAAWILLTLNLVTWAYPGGGGRCWNPVDNIALIPWLVASVLLHRTSGRAIRDIARAWTVSRLAIPFIATIAAGIAVLLLAPATDPISAIALVLAIGVVAASVAPLAGRNLLRVRLSTWGMLIAHLGIAVSLAGLAGSNAFTRETTVAVAPGEEVAVGPWRVRFVGIEAVVGPGWTALRARLTAARGDSIVRMTPQARTANDPPTDTSEADTATRLDGRLHAVIGQSDGAGRWPLRFRWAPMATLIWLGGLMAALGGLLALIGHARRRRRN